MSPPEPPTGIGAGGKHDVFNEKSKYDEWC